MDKTTTRAMAKKQKAKVNALISGHDENRSKDNDKSSDPVTSPEKRQNLVHKYKSNKPLSLRDKMKKMFIFLLGSMGSKSTLFNSGGLPVHALERLMIPNSNHLDRGAPEYKIEFHDRSLQSNMINKYRKHMEIRDLIEDEEDEDWSFVPKAILDHKKVVTQRYLLKMYQDNRETKSKLLRNSQMQVKVLWKDGTISWCGGR